MSRHAHSRAGAVVKSCKGLTDVKLSDHSPVVAELLVPRSSLRRSAAAASLASTPSVAPVAENDAAADISERSSPELGRAAATASRATVGESVASDAPRAETGA